MKELPAGLQADKWYTSENNYLFTKSVAQTFSGKDRPCFSLTLFFTTASQYYERV